MVVNPLKAKLRVQLQAAALTGIAGGVYARYASSIHPQGVFAFHTSVAILLMPIIGGAGTVAGPVIGGLRFGLLAGGFGGALSPLHLPFFGSGAELGVLFWSPAAPAGRLEARALYEGAWG